MDALLSNKPVACHLRSRRNSAEDDAAPDCMRPAADALPKRQPGSGGVPVLGDTDASILAAKKLRQAHSGHEFRAEMGP